jgi:putative PIN family toxin of toxin-antitoxin system
MDTNVLYQALRSNKGASHYILLLIRNRKIRIALSIPVFLEYEEVLKRKTTIKDLALDLADIEKVLFFIAYIGIPYDLSYIFRPNLKDETDNKFIELSIVSNAQYIVTNNVKDFKHNKNLNFPDIHIITPSDFLKKWRRKNEK